MTGSTTIYKPLIQPSNAQKPLKIGRGLLTVTTLSTTGHFVKTKTKTRVSIANNNSSEEQKNFEVRVGDIL